MKDKHSLVSDTRDLPWVEVSAGGEQKLLASADDQDRFTTSILRLAPQAALPPLSGRDGREMLVLEGDLDVGTAQLQAGDYARQPAAADRVASTRRGCTVFVKEGPLPESEQEPMHVRTEEAPWLPGHGNLSVKTLHSFGSEGTALVHWPAGERFVSHQHWGGEEILVLSGTFIDEHGHYPAGTWMRSPHLSSHHPFVEEETVIFVKTGHLQSAAPQHGVAPSARGF